MRNAFAVTVLVAALAAAGGCAGNKPKPDQVFLMPAPGIYEEGRIDPFIDDDPISRGAHPGILYATDRAVAAADDRKYDYYTHERGGVLRLGEAHTRLGVDDGITWEEARRITLLKNRTENYPLEVTGIEEFGVLDRTIPPFDGTHERSDAARERFADEIRERLARSDRKHVYIYVHGYKVNFENPVLVASELWHFLGYNGAFIAYSWPTKFSVWAYVADLENAMSSARNLRTLILEVAAIREVERIDVIGYSAGTRIVSRVLADLGMYGYSLSREEIDARVKLGNVILIGSDVDRSIMSGYLIDGALRIPASLTIYQSQDDGALNMSKKVFRHDRSGQMVIDGPMTPQAERFFAEHPDLWIIDVTNAEGGTDHGGHSYFRTSPWVSSDILMTLMYGLSPGERGLVKYENFPVWDFPDDYVTRLRSSIAEVNPAIGEAIRQGSRFRGHLVWGHENRSFTECGGEREGWVINQAGEELAAVYNELTTAPYQPMFVEVRGDWVAPPPEGFGAAYDEALQVTELLRAENEGFGCRLALDGILFVASGNEPSWRVQVRNDGITLRSMDTPEEVVFAAPKQHGRAPLVSFESGGGDSAIRVTLQQRRCVDTMSGARFAWAATVDIDGRQLTGCAAEGL